jgi:hypothetical protein
MKTLPRSSLVVIETKLFLQLLMGLLTDPSGFDRGSQAAQIHLGWQVGDVVLFLSRRTVLADEPSLVAGETLLIIAAYPLQRPVGDAHTDGSKSGFQPAPRAVAPTHSSPFDLGEQVFSRFR